MDPLHCWPRRLRRSTIERLAIALVLGSSPAIPAPAEDDGGVTSPPASPTKAATAPEPLVLEPAYPVGARPRADGAVQASVADEELARWNVGGSADPSCVSNRAGYHVAPRVKVDTTVRRCRLPPRAAKKGVLSQAAVLAQARSRGYWPFRLCFEAGLRQDAKLRGKTQVRLTVLHDGRVASSRILSSELREPQTAKCLASRSHALKFSPGPARRIEVDVQIDLTPGDAPLPEVPEPLVPAGRQPVSVAPTVDLSNVDSVLGRATASLAECYRPALARDPQLWGRVGARVDLDAAGTPSAVREDGSRFPAPEVVTCVLASVRALTFTPPRGSGPGAFVVGLHFGSPPRTGTPAPPTTPQIAPSSGPKNGTVAESAPPRVRLTQ